MSISKVPDGFADQLCRMDPPVTLVVNDGTRPSPAQVLKSLLPFLGASFRIIFATGAHRPPDPVERRRILGAVADMGIQETSNDCDDGSQVFIGTTSWGTPVELHPWLLEGSVLGINTVEPHYFAGFTGGRKSFLPGCASRKTITSNHFLACFPGSAAGRLHGNPVHLDMEEGAGLLYERTPCLMVNGTSMGEVFSGLPGESFVKAAEKAAVIHGVPVEEPFSSLTVTPGGPLEGSLYQSLKAVFLWADAVETGGSLVLESPCNEGLGAPQMDRILKLSAGILNPPKDRSDYLLGDHAALRLSSIRRRIRLSLETDFRFDDYGFPERAGSGGARLEGAGFLFPVMRGTDA